MSKKTHLRIASIVLIIHGIIEVSGLFLISYNQNGLISFGSLTGDMIYDNRYAIGIVGLFWGLIRILAAMFSLRRYKWAIVLGVMMSVSTIICTITIFPAIIVDTFLSSIALVFLLMSLYGNTKVE